MSVALLIMDSQSEPAKRMVPVATQQIFVANWLPGAKVLGLEWVELMETGFPVTSENRDDVVRELAQLRGWMAQHLGSDAYELERLDRLVAELTAVRFEPGISVFLG